MSNFDISGAVFNDQLRMLETTDPAHADMFNALFGQLIQNDVALRDAASIFAKNKNEQALFLLNLRRTGKRYGVHFNAYNVSPASEGTRLYDAVGKVAIPSTDTVRNRNDFEGESVFYGLEVNGSVGTDGEFVVQYIKGIDNEFSREDYVRTFFAKCLQVQSLITCKDRKAKDSRACTSAYFYMLFVIKIFAPTALTCR